MPAKPQLSPLIKDEYKLLKLTPGKYFIPGYGEVDFTTMNIQMAKNLEAFGYKNLVKIKKK